MRKIILSLLLVTVVFSADNFTKVIHNTDPNAKCLDGSSPMIYLHEGGDTKNILFHLIGGGACLGLDLQSTLESCYKRGKGEFGSSTKWPDTYPGGEAGVLSTDPKKSAFANWTKVVMIYCDGAFHQGNNNNPIKYKDAELYFRGAVNTRSHFKWTDMKYNLSAAERIVLTGSSAGGIGVYLWDEYLRGLVDHPERVYSVADSSIFYDPLIHLYSPEKVIKMVEERNLEKLLTVETSDDEINPIKILMSLSNADEKPPNKACSELLTKEEEWRCLFVQFAYATLPHPILFVESSYDQFIIEAVYQFHCLKDGVSGLTPKDCKDWQMEAIELYRSFYLERFLPLLLKWGHSIWSISCSWHAKLFDSVIYDSDLQKVPKEQGRTMRNATEAFVLEHKRIEAVDLFAWPANTPCAY
jgi:hypothetical protein